MREQAPAMVRFAVLAALVTACFAAVPSAHAAVLGVDVQSTTAATLAKAPAVTTVVTTATDAAQPVVTKLAQRRHDNGRSGHHPHRGDGQGAVQARRAGPDHDGGGRRASVQRFGELNETASAAAQRPATTGRSASPVRQGHTGRARAHRGSRRARPASASPSAPTPAATDTTSAPRRPAPSASRPRPIDAARDRRDRRDRAGRRLCLRRRHRAARGHGLPRRAAPAPPTCVQASRTAAGRLRSAARAPRLATPGS